MDREQAVEQLSDVAERALALISVEMLKGNYEATLKLIQIIAASTTMLAQITPPPSPQEQSSFDFTPK